MLQIIFRIVQIIDLLTMGKSRHFTITEFNNFKSAISIHKGVVIITHEQYSNSLRYSEECKR